MCTSFDDIKTHEDGLEMIEAVSKDAEDKAEFVWFYNKLRKKGYNPKAAFNELVYCYGLDLV